MATNKRRKVETAEPSQSQSAFARLRSLRSQAGAATPPAEAQSPAKEVHSQHQEAGIGEARLATPKRPKRGRVAQPAQGISTSVPSRDGLSPEVDGACTPYAAQRDSGTPSDSVTSESTAIQFSSFKPNKANFRKKPGGRIQLRLSGGERLVILGSYGITVTTGETTVYGATLRASSKAHWVHVSHCHALPVIRCPGEAVIELESCPAASSLRQLGRLSPLFRKLWNESSGPEDVTAGTSTFSILYTSTDGPKKVVLSDLKSPPEWNREIERLAVASRTKPLVVLVTGPKSAGKSTFGRLLSNQLLTTKLEKKRSSDIAVLDLDPGQPEHGPPGQISLVRVTAPILSPSFCRLVQQSADNTNTSIIRSHTLASVSPASDPDLYIAAVTDLITHYRNRLGSLHLVINTPGWIQGTGLDLLTSVIELIRPSHVIYMAAGPLDVIETLQETFRSGEITRLPSQTNQYTVRTPAHLRTMQTMSYFHSQADLQRWNAEPLSAVPPWQVKYAGSAPGIIGIMCYDYQAPSHILADAINGTVLAVVEIENRSAIQRHRTDASSKTARSVQSESDEALMSSTDDVGDAMFTRTPEGIPFTQSGSTLDPRYSHTLGLALLRGIDTKNQTLHLLSPISEEKIQDINNNGGQIILVSGKFDSPSWAYTEDLYSQSITNNEEIDEHIDIAAEDEAIDAIQEPADVKLETASMPTPWIEVLRGSQKRGAGSQVWRVRRDLGRTNNAS